MCLYVCLENGFIHQCDVISVALRRNIIAITFELKMWPQNHIFSAIISKGKVFISALLYSPFLVFFGPSYYSL